MRITLPAAATLRDYQDYIHQLEAMKGWLDNDLVYNCFLMGEEVGELFGAVRSLSRAQPEARAQATAAVGEELVDVLNFLLAIANRLDIDVEAAFRQKNLRNQGRTWSP